MPKINGEKLNASVNSFVENPHWKEYLDGAPSEECKKYIKLGFYLSDLDYEDGDRGYVIKAMDGYEEGFGVSDWKYLLKYAGNNPFAGKCRKKISELENNRAE